MNFSDDVLLLIGEQLRAVEEALRTALSGSAPEVRPILAHLVESGGKRARPVMTLLSAKLFSEDVASVVPVAAAAEFIHMATLVHDDVIDTAVKRRGRPTVNRLWGNRYAVLAGDALLARALVMLVRAEKPQVIEVMARMIHQVCEGEISQNANLHNANQTEAEYFDRIEKKTALFFAACCKAGALVAGASGVEVSGMHEYGRLVGLAFQVIDDVLDIVAEAEVVGKPVGRDLASGVLTLPIIHALHQPEYGQSIRDRLAKGSLSSGDVEHVLSLVRTNGAIEYAQRVAASLADQAKKVLPPALDTKARDLLSAMAEMVVCRSF